MARRHAYRNTTSIADRSILVQRYPNLILASQSPRRRHLLHRLGFSFRVDPSAIEEVFNPTQTPARNAKRVALEKAREVSERHPAGIILGADTIVVLGSSMFAKPHNRKDAFSMLRKLSGRTHTVVTGIALVDTTRRKSIVRSVSTRVTFRRLSDDEIRSYIRSGSPMDKAGAYGIQDDYGALFVKRIQGCFYNVVGLPLVALYEALSDLGYKIPVNGQGKRRAQ